MSTSTTNLQWLPARSKCLILLAGSKHPWVATDKPRVPTA
jgi:hypothetical protein